jgi:ferredoxin
MGLAAFRSGIEKAIFGITLDDLMDQIRAVSRSVDDISARLDRDMASVRKDLRQFANASSDPRDGLYIVEDDCISCQVCTEVAPSTFRMRDDGIAEVHNVYGSDMTKVVESIESCGGSCIKLT